MATPEAPPTSPLVGYDNVNKVYRLVSVDENGKISIDGTFSADPPVGGATEVKQDAAITAIGGLTETAPATDTASAGLNGRLQRVTQRLTSLIGLVGEAQASPTQYTVLDRLKALLTGIVLAAGENHVGEVGGRTAVAAGSMARPADTTAYAAGDGVTTATSSASAMTVTGVARIAGGTGLIIGGRALKSTTTTTNASFRLWLYQDTPTAIPNDNAAFSAAVVADRAKLIGRATADFSGSSAVAGSDGLTVPLTLERTQMAFDCAAGSTSLIVIWEARAAYSPGSAEVFHLLLDVLQD